MNPELSGSNAGPKNGFNFEEFLKYPSFEAYQEAERQKAKEAERAKIEAEEKLAKAKEAESMTADYWNLQKWLSQNAGTEEGGGHQRTEKERQAQIDAAEGERNINSATDKERTFAPADVYPHVAGEDNAAYSERWAGMREAMKDLPKDADGAIDMEKIAAMRETADENYVRTLMGGKELTVANVMAYENHLIAEMGKLRKEIATMRNRHEQEKYLTEAQQELAAMGEKLDKVRSVKMAVEVPVAENEDDDESNVLGDGLLDGGEAGEDELDEAETAEGDKAGEDAKGETAEEAPGAEAKGAGNDSEQKEAGADEKAEKKDASTETKAEKKGKILQFLRPKIRAWQKRAAQVAMLAIVMSSLILSACAPTAPANAEGPVAPETAVTQVDSGDDLRVNLGETEADAESLDGQVDEIYNLLNEGRSESEVAEALKNIGVDYRGMFANKDGIGYNLDKIDFESQVGRGYYDNYEVGHQFTAEEAAKTKAKFLVQCARQTETLAQVMLSVQPSVRNLMPASIQNADLKGIEGVLESDADAREACLKVLADLFASGGISANAAGKNDKAAYISGDDLSAEIKSDNIYSVAGEVHEGDVIYWLTGSDSKTGGTYMIGWDESCGNVVLSVDAQADVPVVTPNKITAPEDEPTDTEDKGDPDDEKPDDDKPDDGDPDDGKPDEGGPEDGKPDEGDPDDGKPDEGGPEDKGPEDKGPDDGEPDDGEPGPGPGPSPVEEPVAKNEVAEVVNAGVDSGTTQLPQENPVTEEPVMPQYNYDTNTFVVPTGATGQGEGGGVVVTGDTVTQDTQGEQTGGSTTTTENTDNGNLGNGATNEAQGPAVANNFEADATVATGMPAANGEQPTDDTGRTAQEMAADAEGSTSTITVTNPESGETTTVENGSLAGFNF